MTDRWYGLTVVIAGRGPVVWAAVLVTASMLTACSGTSRHAASPITTLSRPSSQSSSSPSLPSSASSTTRGTLPAQSCTNLGVIETWSLPRRAAELIAAPILDGGSGPLTVAVSQHVGGLVLLGSVPPASQLASELKQASDSSGSPQPLIMADQEGGGVQRLGSDVMSLPWPRTMAQTLSTSTVTTLAEGLGRQMKALYVNVDLAPVLDVDGGPGPSATDPDGMRSFSADPTVAGRYGVSFMQGLEMSGVLAVLKHFPGLGGASANTDYGPASTPTLTTLQSRGLIPFQVAITAGARAVMISNASVPGLTSQPASLSTAVISGMLRQQLRFQGLVMTDSLSAGAVQAAGYTVPAAAVAAVKAGADMVLFGSTLTPAEVQLLNPNGLAKSIESIVGQIAGAASDGSLPVARLDDAVDHIVTATGANLCGAASG
jgi:beta-N-acetylhexosaminidase